MTKYMPSYKDSKIYNKKEDNQAKMTKSSKDSSPQINYKYSSLKKSSSPNLKASITKEPEINSQMQGILCVPKITLNLTTDILPFIDDSTSPIKKSKNVLNHSSMNSISRLFK